MTRVTHYTPDSVLSSGQVAALLGIGRRQVWRIPRDRLDWWETPGGEHRKHRRYEAGHVAAYASRYLGLRIAFPDAPTPVAQG